MHGRGRSTFDFHRGLRVLLFAGCLGNEIGPDVISPADFGREVESVFTRFVARNRMQMLVISQALIDYQEVNLFRVRDFEFTERIAAPDSLQLKGEVPQAGVAALWVKLPSRTIDLKPDEVEHYLEEVSAPESLRKQWTEMEEPRRWRESYTKHQKTFVRVGDPKADRSWSEPVGIFLEIVPETDPTAVKAGDDFPVRVLKGGSPLAGFALNAVSAGEEKGETKKTDAEGRVRFRLNKAGPWLLRGTEIRKSIGGEVDWESDFTTVTLEVRAK